MPGPSPRIEILTWKLGEIKLGKFFANDQATNRTSSSKLSMIYTSRKFAVEKWTEDVHSSEWMGWFLFPFQLALFNRIFILKSKNLLEPMSLGDGCVAADGVILISQPHDQNHVEGGGGVVEELRHDGFDSWKTSISLKLFQKYIQFKHFAKPTRSRGRLSIKMLRFGFF